MIKALRVVNPYGDDPLDLILTSSHEDEGIYIKSITGIGPESANINTTALAMEDGGVFNSARADNRNIVIDLGFYESTKLHNSIEDSRQKTYKYFPKKKKITLQFITDNRESFITGYVESNTPDIFSDKESTQISIICPDPNFYSLKESQKHMGGVQELFEFPFENRLPEEGLTIVGGIPTNKQKVVSNHLSVTGEVGVTYYELTSTENYYNEWMYVGGLTGWYEVAENKLVRSASLIMGEISQGNIREIKYEGDNDVGVTMDIHFTGSASGIRIQHLEKVNNIDVAIEDIEIVTSRIEESLGLTIDNGDDIIINTRPSDKSIKFVKDGNTYDILNLIDKEYLYTCWFKLKKGINRYMFNAETGFDNVKITINSYVAYDGV